MLMLVKKRCTQRCCFRQLVICGPHQFGGAELITLHKKSEEIPKLHLSLQVFLRFVATPSRRPTRCRGLRTRASRPAAGRQTTRMAPRRVSHACALSPLEYWSLRTDDSFNAYVAAADGNTHKVISRGGAGGAADDGTSLVLAKLAEIEARLVQIEIEARSKPACGCTLM